MRRVFLVVMVLAILALIPVGVSAYGNLTISSTPSGVHVYIDDVSKGTSTSIGNVEIGDRIVKLSMDNYLDYLAKVTVYDGNESTVTATLIPMNRSLFISSVPSGATIYLDNANIGLTPFSSSNVKYGSHSVILKLSGYNDISIPILVNSTAADVNVNMTSTSTIAPIVNGSVFFEINPPSARVYINSTYIGANPLYLYNLTPGTYDVLIQQGGYRDKNDKFVVTANNQTHYYLYMTAVAATTTEIQTTATTAPTTTITTARTTKKATTKPVTSWPSETAKPSPVPEAFAILGAVGLGLLVLRRK